MTTTQQARACDGQWDNRTYSSAKNDVPEDYVGDFIQPLKATQCCVLRRREKGRDLPRPKRCDGRKCRDRLTCSGHLPLDGKAKAWAKGAGNV